MNIVRNEKGVALITALMFTLICLGMIMTLLYYVLAGTRMSAAQKRYRNALEASYGGTDFITKSIIPRLFNNYSAGKLALQSDFGTSLGLTFAPNDPLKTKLTMATSAWPATISKTVDPKDSPDLTFSLDGTSGNKFKVYTKIIDTVPGIGLIDATGIDYLDAGIGVAGTSNSTQTPRTPNLYSIEVQGEAAVNPREKAALSVLYAY
ncbi:pilus assembly protein PilX [Geotalea sp. SG265]|uniref:pilus assembly protein PilX n=1 Tax=Geotalea sp. SG265 TaxID=2922867 RepID=UPI001FAEB588|nr:pilus assembly protein PilX [Geotalea sp. SG265]